MAGSILLSSVYGYEVTSTDERLVKIVEAAFYRLGQVATFAGSKCGQISTGFAIVDSTDAFSFSLLGQCCPVASACSCMVPGSGMETECENVER